MGRPGQPRPDHAAVVRGARARSGRTCGSAAQLRAGRSPGPESSIGKVHQGALNQRIQLWPSTCSVPRPRRWSPGVGELGECQDSLPYEVRGMLRSRANTIEGGTTEVNKNILGERVLGLPANPTRSRPSVEEGSPKLTEEPGSSQASEYVHLERRDGVAIVTLDHPADRNALSLNMTLALTEVVKRVTDEGDVGALIVAGAGPVFSAGGSVDDLFEPKAPLVEMYGGVIAVAQCGLPTIAAVNGPRSVPG